MKINSIINDNVLRKEFIIKTGTIVRKGLLYPSDCPTLGIDKVSNMRVVDYGENTMMKKLGVDQAIFAKPCGEKDKKKSLVLLFKNGKAIYQKPLLSNFDGLKNFIRKLRNEFEAKNIDNMKLRVPAEPVIKFEKNEAGKLIKSEEGEFLYDEQDRHICEVDRHGVNTIYTKEGRIESKVWRDGVWHIYENYDVHTGHLLKREKYWDDIKIVQEFNPEAPGHLLKETQTGGAGPWDTEEFYRTEPPYTKYKEIRKARYYEETVYYDSYGNETGMFDNKKTRLRC